MQYYKIKETLEPSSYSAILEGPEKFVAVLASEEWPTLRDSFRMGIDMEMPTGEIHETRAIVNYDSLTGSFSVPDRKKIDGPDYDFSFALDEKGIVFIDDSGFVDKKICLIAKSKKWKLPSLERFIYDFLESIIDGDLALLDEKEQRLIDIEDSMESDDRSDYPQMLNDIRGELLTMRSHYEQLIDLGQELEENENGFFAEENLRYFRLFTERVLRLQDNLTNLRDYIAQLRDFFQAKVDVKQNRIMTILTIITSIFMPLTLIAGWYGMNFRYMPELYSIWGYPAVILVSIAIVVGCLVYFRKKKWL
ncbi:MAG: magnesium transporter CorA [Firmicutes bacterium]|nr:magnesium transporter CorA [Bacillota bacterium]